MTIKYSKRCTVLSHYANVNKCVKLLVKVLKHCSDDTPFIQHISSGFTQTSGVCSQLKLRKSEIQGNIFMILTHVVKADKFNGI